MGFLTSVDHLDVGMSRDQERRRLAPHNCITVVPKSIVHMEKLKYLNLSGNSIRELPPDFGSLVSLVHLDMGEAIGRILEWDLMSWATL